jgi:uncharacterized RDD family membrane protein YckC
MRDENLLDVVIEDENRYDYYAVFGDRFAAAFIDGLILLIPNLFFKFYLSEDIELVANITLGCLYSASQESGEYQATFGKRAMNIVVTDMNGERINFFKALIRHLAKILSAILLLIGYIIQPFTEKRQALHDMIVGTLVYKR